MKTKDELAEVELVDSLPSWARERGYWARSLEPLRAHPGVWAKVTKMRATSASSIAASINHGLVLLPPGIWRAARRNGHVYVCFCGDRPNGD